MGGFDVQDWVPRNPQGSLGGIESTSSECYEILPEALMTMLTVGLFSHSPYRSDSFCWHRLHALRLNLFWARDQILANRCNNPELLQTPLAAHAVTTNLNRDLNVWSDALSNFSTGIGLRFPTHPPRAIDIPMQPLPRFPNLHVTLSSDGTYLQNTPSDIIHSPQTTYIRRTFDVHSGAQWNRWCWMSLSFPKRGSVPPRRSLARRRESNETQPIWCVELGWLASVNGGSAFPSIDHGR